MTIDGIYCITKILHYVVICLGSKQGLDFLLNFFAVKGLSIRGIRTVATKYMCRMRTHA